MSRLELSILDSRAIDTDAFLDASDRELRVLVALRELGGDASVDQLCRICSVSEARLAAAIAFWTRAGVIAEKRITDEGEFGNRIIEEFEERPLAEDLDELGSRELAEEIRKGSLRSLFEEIAALMGKSELSYMEMNRIAAMISQYKLDDEYLAMLAAHMAERNMLTVNRLCLKVKGLINNEICCVDALIPYLASEEEVRSSKYIEYRNVLGIYNRALGESERSLIDKWTGEFCFGTEIVKKAYDYSVMATGNRSLPYMDKLLSDWHANGCTTLDACTKRHDLERTRMLNERTDGRTDNVAPRRERKNTTPRFGDFDPEEVMKRALERTYASEGSDNEGD